MRRALLARRDGARVYAGHMLLLIMYSGPLGRGIVVEDWGIAPKSDLELIVAGLEVKIGGWEISLRRSLRLVPPPHWARRVTRECRRHGWSAAAATIG